MIDIIAGSKSDSHIVDEVAKVLKENNVIFEINYISAHTNLPKYR